MLSLANDSLPFLTPSLHTCNYIHLSILMRPTQINFAAAKKTSFIRSIPVELTPLFIACGVACCSAVYFTNKKLRTDKTLRLGRKNPEFNEKFEEVVGKSE